MKKKYLVTITKERIVWEEADIEVEIDLEDGEEYSKEDIEFELHEKIDNESLLDEADDWIESDYDDKGFEIDEFKEIKND